jgi:hypothetical protein
MLHGIKRKRFFERETVGIGRIIIPAKQDREVFLTHCYQTTTVSFISRENGGDIVHDVDIDPEVLSRIEFPENSDRLGSTVVWVNIPVFNRPMIVALLNNKDSMSLLDEGQFNFLRSYKGTTVSISGRARSGNLTINVSSSQNGSDLRNGKMNIYVSNKDNTAQLDVKINGSLILDAIKGEQTFTESHEVVVSDFTVGSKKTNFKIENEQIESRIKEGTSGYKYDEESFELGDASKTAAFAEELESMFHGILDELAKTQVTTAIGPSPLLNVAQLQALKKDTTKFFSKYLKIQ